MLLHVYLIDPFQPLELHDLLVRRPSQVQLRDYADPFSQRSGTRWTGHKNDEIWLLFDIKIQKSSKIPGWFELPRFCLGHQFMNRANNKPQVAWGGIYIYIFIDLRLSSGDQTWQWEHISFDDVPIHLFNLYFLHVYTWYPAMIAG